MNTLLITGTDTDVGKTVLTTALAAYWQTYRSGESFGLMKLIQTGSGDHELYNQLFEVNPSWEVTAPLHFQTPVAPPIAAAQEERPIELGWAWQTLRSAQQQRSFVLVEALGGLGSPVTDEITVADLAADWRLPVVLVVPVRLGAIAQVVANVALARQSGLCLRGVVLNCLQPEAEQQLANFAPNYLIQSLTNVPVLGTLPYLAEPTDLAQWAQVASQLDLEQLLDLSSKMQEINSTNERDLESFYANFTNFYYSGS